MAKLAELSAMQPPLQATYHPQVFSVGSIDEAMRIILTEEGSTTTALGRRDSVFR
jgi:hypothetical protein